MTRPPSAIIVVRHGARLDAADRNWHLSSPAPYDPPLTYGGWNQAKALGVRIASIVQARASISTSKGENSGENRKPGVGAQDSRERKRKQKVIIHSSPFLRCLQTSVAIGAGMAASIEEAEDERRKRLNSRRAHKNSVPVIENEDEEQSNIKTTIRVDAFLGEWLSPDYFEHITPPPNSTLMVAAAKAHLLRREQIQVFQPTTAGNGYFPGGWSRPGGITVQPRKSSSAIEEDEESASVADIHPQVPHRAASHSFHGNAANGASQTRLKAISSSLADTKSLYNPPIPTYAVAPSDPIPRGYCVHARDACTDVDLLWDSMRQPQDWGDGGELGEEWSAMHKRFRAGLFKMITWYKQHSPEFHPDREDPLALDHEEEEDEEDDDYDLVLVLVTHSAGCNALVGALTNHPVLLDFGLTSMSMAVRREIADDYVSSSQDNGSAASGRRRSSVDFGISEEYEMKMVASTGHLRAGIEATKIAVLQSPHLVPQIPEFRLSHHPDSPPTARNARMDGYGLPENGRSLSSALGSVRRNSTNPSSYRNSSVSPSRTSRSSGLWSKAHTATSSIDEAIEELSLESNAERRPESSDSDRPLPNVFRRSSGTKTPISRDEQSTTLPQTTSRRVSVNGLWGPPPTTTENTVRDFVPKRRWTMSEPDEDNI